MAHFSSADTLCSPLHKAATLFFAVFLILSLIFYLKGILAAFRLRRPILFIYAVTAFIFAIGTITLVLSNCDPQSDRLLAVLYFIWNIIGPIVGVQIFLQNRHILRPSETLFSTSNDETEPKIAEQPKKKISKYHLGIIFSILSVCQLILFAYLASELVRQTSSHFEVTFVGILNIQLNGELVFKLSSAYNFISIFVAIIGGMALQSGKLKTALMSLQISKLAIIIVTQTQGDNVSLSLLFARELLEFYASGIYNVFSFDEDKKVFNDWTNWSLKNCLRMPDSEKEEQSKGDVISGAPVKNDVKITITDEAEVTREEAEEITMVG
ncbi:hypothetical protein BKA69DRAFT_1040945 [Paraphysoderma sedebokerense]|nr:hypothetical protein BKA69DRAFT_1040945 [Paraphysoderma sedebokerense]